MHLYSQNNEQDQKIVEIIVQKRSELMSLITFLQSIKENVKKLKNSKFLSHQIIDKLEQNLVITENCNIFLIVKNSIQNFDELISGLKNNNYDPLNLLLNDFGTIDTKLIHQFEFNHECYLMNFNFDQKSQENLPIQQNSYSTQIKMTNFSNNDNQKFLLYLVLQEKYYFIRIMKKKNQTVEFGTNIIISTIQKQNKKLLKWFNFYPDKDLDSQIIIKGIQYSHYYTQKMGSNRSNKEKRQIYKLGCGRKIKDLDLENKMIDWCKQNWHLSPTKKQICREARRLNTAKDFKASRGWLMQFLKRNNMISLIS